MRQLIIIFILVFSAHLPVQSQGYPHPGGMHPEEQIIFVRKMVDKKVQPYLDAYHQLIQKADSTLEKELHVLEDFNVPGFYQDAAGHRRNSSGFQSDAFGAYACALAWQLSGDRKYAERSMHILMEWGRRNKTYSDFDGPLVMSYSGTAMVMAGELMYNYPGWKAADRDIYFGWVRNVYRRACNEIRNRTNNWADWGRFGSALCAYLLDDSEEMKENIRLVKSDLFHKIAPDGHMPEETRREANGIWYTYFSLAPITAACNVIRNATGEDLFILEEDGRSIRNALDYLYHFNQHPEQWTWFKNPRPGSPQSWPGNLFEAMGPVYGEKKYSTYVDGVRPLVYERHHFAWSFPTLMPPVFENRQGHSGR